MYLFNLVCAAKVAWRKEEIQGWLFRADREIQVPLCLPEVVGTECFWKIRAPRVILQAKDCFDFPVHVHEVMQQPCYGERTGLSFHRYVCRPLPVKVFVIGLNFKISGLPNCSLGRISAVDFITLKFLLGFHEVLRTSSN